MTALIKTTDEQITLAELAELQREIDGPITEQNKLDKIRARSRGAYAPEVETVASLTAKIKWARNDLRFYKGNAENLEAEIANLMAERDGVTYAASELDRKTRHINALVRQLDGIKEHMRPYEVIIEDAQSRLSAITNISVAAE